VKAFRIEELAADLRYMDLPGHEPTLVYIHGLGTASSFAFPQIVSSGPLRDRRSILIDLLGFGYSDHPDSFSYSMDDQAAVVARLLEALLLQDVVLFGHSLGGAVAILAAAATRRVSRLIVAEPNLDPEPGIVSGLIAKWNEQEYIASGHSDLVGKMQTAGFDGYARTLEATDARAAHRSALNLIGPRTPTFRNVFLELPIPRRFVIAEENLADPDTEWMPANGVPVFTVPDSGHDMMTDNPVGLVEAISRALES